MRRKIRLYSLIENYKKILEEKKVGEIFQKKEELKGLLEELERINQEKVSQEKALFEKKSLSGEELKEKLLGIKFIKERMKTTEKKIKLKEREIDLAREELKRLHMEKRLFSRLKEKTEIELREEEKKEFYKELDETGLILMNHLQEKIFD